MRMLALVCWNDLLPVYQEQEQGLLILLTLLVDHAFHPKIFLVMFHFLSWTELLNLYNKTNVQEICENQIVPSGVVLRLSETPFHPILIQEKRFFLLLRSYVPQNLQVRQAYSCKEEIIITVTGSFSIFMRHNYPCRRMALYFSINHLFALSKSSFCCSSSRTYLLSSSLISFISDSSVCKSLIWNGR